jgi:hypothetical protein
MDQTRPQTLSRWPSSLQFHLKLQIIEIRGNAIGIFASHHCDHPVNLRGLLFGHDPFGKPLHTLR